MDLRDPKKIASNARLIIKCYLNGNELDEKYKETTWRPQGKEWNALDNYLRRLVRAANKKNGRPRNKEKEELAEVLAGIDFIYNITTQLVENPEENKIEILYFLDQMKKEDEKHHIHTLKIYE